MLRLTVASQFTHKTFMNKIHESLSQAPQEVKIKVHTSDTAITASDSGTEQHDLARIM